MGELAFLLKKILTPLLLPPTSLLLCIALGLSMMRRWPRLGKFAAWGALTVLIVLSLPATARLLADSIVVESAVATAAGRDAQAIVILGGGRIVAPEYGGMTVSGATLERVRYGAKLARELRLPVLVTGGAVFGSGPTEGELMAATLRDSFAVPVQWIESGSRDTHQNAVLSAAMLKAAGVRSVLLVTSDLHERRALREFNAAGISAVPAPVSTAAHAGKKSLPEQLPNVGALNQSVQVLHEIVGTLLLAPGTTAAP